MKMEFTRGPVGREGGKVVAKEGVLVTAGQTLLYLEE